MSEDHSNYLIVGLGNVGPEHDKTRHNVGFDVVDFFAKKNQTIFQKPSKIKGVVGKLKIEEKKVFLLKPTTYMNLSGEAVYQCVSYYKIPLNNLLVIVDDVDVPFGEIKMKKEGGTAGHNGLKSIEEKLRTKAYARLKIGISGRSPEIAAHVLGKFSKTESEDLPKIIKKAAHSLELWLLEGIDRAMNFANTTVAEKKSPKEVEQSKMRDNI